ncbi:DUF938 domain-containing protein [Pseudoalteromonas luteoviolacea]|uniref:Methylase n=1 Tax=Pseudoalteromonas luteoviolacea H33 TaxID=1365251 RepID=A0A167CJ50_9GAMM|nr:DUF938 domain-containing protein [Pseudoalteromonas luteoviolacea]KZN47724.1 hypothetical protein N476_23255 [Pseudoalteromonas luteoviolacea H33]KZN75759.1 hypothetical protein N477_17580 [Pseudoalteromonas luteoviolacea H33-S]
MTKPYSQACENNKGPILAHLGPFIGEMQSVLEVGSGTGQHAVHFAKALPHVIWQTADLPCNHEGIISWCEEAALDNLRLPLALDLNQQWPVAKVPVIYTANTLHIISKALVERFFSGVERHLDTDGKVIIYGPFNYQGAFTSQSNAQFDAFLKSRDPHSGIRDIEWIMALATAAGLKLVADHAMPANNRLLCFKRQ